MNELWEILTFVAMKVRGIALNAKFSSTIINNGLFIVAMEAVTRRNWRRYFTRGFLTDATYLLFFSAGFYYFFISGPVGRGIRSVLTHLAPSILNLNLLGFLPLLLQSAALVVAIDGIEYGMHRLGHSNRWYWKFHCIHHSAENLNPLTKFRFHWVDMTIFGTVKHVPAIALGIYSPGIWMPILPLGFLQILSHFDLPWTYGWLGKIVVSPGFHRVHHSTDAAQCNKNFGIIFSFWDYLFGTAASDLSRPAAYGIPGGMKVPEGFVRQFFYPFLLVVRDLLPQVPQTAAAKPEPS